MQDRFKFRFFNKIANKMVLPINYANVDCIYECLAQQVCYDEDIQPLPYNHIGNGIVFMQCTGLKDKNGKLIYEGDIIKIGNGSVNGSVIETTREVKWIINTWNVPIWVVDKPNFSHYVEVIGNIYENTELLEEKYE